MNELKEKIINILKSNRKYSLKELKKVLEDYKEIDICNALSELINEGIIYENDSVVRIMPNNFILKQVHLDKLGSGYFFINGIKTNLNNTLGCLDKDICVINLDTNEIVKIVKRDKNLIVCEANRNDGITFDYLSGNQKYNIVLPSNDLKDIVDGHVVLLRIKSSDEKNLYCDLVEILGHVNDPSTYLKSLAITYNFNTSFSKDYIKELNNIPTEVSEYDKINRLDLTHELIYTIDCDDTKDMDDAISIKINENNNYEVGIHIADVSHYVPFNSTIFNEAYLRGNSVYALDTVIPMIDHKLSNGICSLNPNVDRLTLSVIAEFDENLNMINHKIVESVIKSDKKMNYSSINMILRDNIIPEGYEKYCDNLRLANKFSFLLNEKFKNEGYLNFSSKETKYNNDDFGLRKAGPAEKIIENFMLLANKIVATDYEYANIPFRVHEQADEAKIRTCLEKIKSIGFEVDEYTHLNNYILQNIFKKLYLQGDYKITSAIILPTMKKAKYDAINTGHYGLGFKAYTHFTSPIRRFNDLILHVIIKSYMKNDLETIYKLENLEEICNHISNQEINATLLEEQALEYKMASFMEEHLHEYFNGKILDITPNYLKIELENNIIGTSYINDIKGNNFKYDNKTYSIYNDSVTYKIGDYVRVKNIYASKKDLKINFEILENITRVKYKKLEK